MNTVTVQLDVVWRYDGPPLGGSGGGWRCSCASLCVVLAERGHFCDGAGGDCVDRTTRDSSET